MLRCLGTPIAPEVRTRLKALGVDVDKLEPAYDVPTYSKLVDFLGEHLFPKLSREARDEEIGALFIKGFSETLLGKAALAAAKVFGPIRGIHRLTRSMRSVNNYSESGANNVDAHTMEVWIAPVLRPHYYVGVFKEASRGTYGENFKVELVRFENERADFRISW